MIIITESLISECQSAKAICINNVLNAALNSALQYVMELGLPFIVTNTDVRKIIINSMVIELCELKKRAAFGSVFYIQKSKFNSDIINIIDEVVSKMELDRATKSPDFIKKFKKYLVKNGFNYLNNTYLKQVSNKLALFR